MYFLFSIRSVNVAIALLSPLSWVPLVIVHDEFRHTSTITWLMALPHTNVSCMQSDTSMNANVLPHDQYYLKIKSVFPIDVCTGISPHGIFWDTDQFNVSYCVYEVQLSQIECLLLVANYSLDEGVCVIIDVAFPVPTPFTAATTTSSVSPRLLTL